MNAARGTVKLGKGKGPVVPAPQTVPWRYVVEATTPNGPPRGTVEVINEDVRRRPVTT